MAKKKESPTLPQPVSPETTGRKKPKSFKPSSTQTPVTNERPSAPKSSLSKKSQRLGIPDNDPKAKPSAAVEKKKSVTSAKESKVSAKTAAPKKEPVAKKEPASKEAVVKKAPAAKKAVKAETEAEAPVEKKAAAAKKPAAAKKTTAEAAPAVETPAAPKKSVKAKVEDVKAPEEKPKAAPAKAKKTKEEEAPKAAEPVKAKAPAKSVEAPVAKVAKPTVSAPAKAREVVKPAADEIEIRQAYDPKNPPAFVQMQKNRLIELRSSLIDSMDGVVKEVLSSRPEGSDGSVGGMHMGDAGSDAYDRDFALSMLSKEQDALHEINEALLRIDHGVYGVCEMSALPINEERLEALPYTRYTREMQEVIEKEQLGGRFKRPVVRSVFGLDEDGDEDDDDDEEGSSSSSGSNSDSSLDFGKD